MPDAAGERRGWLGVYAIHTASIRAIGRTKILLRSDAPRGRAAGVWPRRHDSVLLGRGGALVTEFSDYSSHPIAVPLA
jgi:hypothetical protein